MEGEKSNPPSIQTGIILSVDPLYVKIGDLQLTKNNILINFSLLRHVSKIDSTNKNIDTCLNVGDTVAVLSTQDLQQYIILCKVV